MFKYCHCTIVCCATISITSAQTSKGVPGLSSVPLWPQNEDTSQLPKGHYVFYDLRAGEYVAYYPSNFDAPDTSDRITLRFGTHSLVDPQITSRISAGTGGAFRYTYVVANGPQARQPIRKLILSIPAEDQSAQFETGTWKTSRADEQIRDIASPLTALTQVEWSSPTDQAISLGSPGAEFTIDSSSLPGFKQMSAKGASASREYTPQAGAEFPKPVSDQLAAVFTPGWDSQTQLVLGPRFRKGASQFEIAPNLLHGIDVLVVHGNLDGTSPFVSRAHSVLTTFLESDGSAPIQAGQLDFLTQAKPGLETQIAAALQIDFGVVKILRAGCGAAWVAVLASAFSVPQTPAPI